MSELYDEHTYCCDRCAEYFTQSEMVEEGEFLYCKQCYKILLESE